MLKIRFKAVVCFALSVLFLGTAFGGYLHCLQNCCEMTFISNASVGFVLLFASVFLLVKNKDIPHFVYLDCAVLLMSVVLVCAVFAPDVCFVGASVLPHLVTPIAMFAFYFIFCDGRDCGTELIMTSAVFPSIYYIFMIVFGRLSGRSVYIYFDSNSMSVLKLVMIGAAAVTLLVFIAAVMLYLNKLLRRKTVDSSGGAYTENSRTR